MQQGNWHDRRRRRNEAGEAQVAHLGKVSRQLGWMGFLLGRMTWQLALDHFLKGCMKISKIR